MNEFLVFRLYGPMVSWGEIAVGEVRRSADRPSRSAILGLVTAALGIKRGETDRLVSVFNGYDVAVKVLSPGTLLKDYHTVQAPDSAGKFSYATRRDELITGRDRLGTILTTREYRCDALNIISMRCRETAPYTLMDLQKSLRSPKYTLYLGRKSCPVSVPLHPLIVKAGGVRESLDAATFPPIVTSYSGEDVTNWYFQNTPPRYSPRYYWEGDAGDMTPQQGTERYDNPGNRERWQFTQRTEYRFSVEGDA